MAEAKFKTINDLPNEILLRIFSHLNLRELYFSCFRVDKRFNNLIANGLKNINHVYVPVSHCPAAPIHIRRPKLKKTIPQETILQEFHRYLAQLVRYCKNNLSVISSLTIELRDYADGSNNVIDKAIADLLYHHLIRLKSLVLITKRPLSWDLRLIERMSGTLPYLEFLSITKINEQMFKILSQLTRLKTLHVQDMHDDDEMTILLLHGPEQSPPSFSPTKLLLSNFTTHLDVASQPIMVEQLVKCFPNVRHRC